MKQLKYQTLAIILLFFFNLNGQTSIMTFNIRYDNPNDDKNWWENRKDEVVQMIAYYHPSILGVQEALKNQVDFLNNKLTSYNYMGVGRDDGKEKGEYAAIFYDSTKFELMETKTYWLSERPDTVSIGWDASMERIVTYGVLRNKFTKDSLYILNCHYDHIGKIARKRSSELILQLIKQKKLDKKRIIVMGDLNSESQNEPIQLLRTLLKDSFESSKRPPYGPIGTFSSFDTTIIPKKRIDYIFTGNLIVEKYRIIDDRRKNNLCLSDHLPVLIEIKNERQ